MAISIDLSTVQTSFTTFCTSLMKNPAFAKMDRNTLIEHIEQGFNDPHIHISDKTIAKYRHELKRETTATKVQFWVASKLLAGSKMAVIK